MKKFGLPALLSVAYVGIMLIVFSTEYSKEHTFLYEENPVLDGGKSLRHPVGEEDLREIRISLAGTHMSTGASEIKKKPANNGVSGLQSAESAVSIAEANQ